MPLSDADLNAALLDALPELRGEYVSVAGSVAPDAEAAGTVYGATLGPWLADRTLISQDTPLRTDDRLRRAFGLVERLAEEPPDSPGDFVLHMYVFHWLFWGPDQLALLPRYAPLMGPRTLAAAQAASPNEDFDRALGGGAAEPAAVGRRRAPALLRWFGLGVSVALFAAVRSALRG